MVGGGVEIKNQTYQKRKTILLHHRYSVIHISHQENYWKLSEIIKIFERNEKKK